MHRTVAKKAEAGEVVERVVRLIFVAVVNVYGDLAVRSAAGLAFAAGILPAIYGRLTVAREKEAVLLVSGRRTTARRPSHPVGIFARLILALASYAHATMALAVVGRSKYSRSAALNADAARSAFGTPFFRALPVFGQALHAHRFARRWSSAAANALKAFFAQHGLDRILVTAKAPRDGNGALQFFVEAQRLYPINLHQSFSGFGGLVPSAGDVHNRS